MGSKRKRGDSWEYHFQKKGLLDRTYSVTFKDEAAGDIYAAKIEFQLKEGKFPDEFKDGGNYHNIGDVIRGYLSSGYIPSSDIACLNVLYARIGVVALRDVTYAWVEKWIVAMKRFHNLSPSTIRHHVGALARCFDWGAKQEITALVMNPIRLLPKRYATYTDDDRRVIEAQNKALEARGDPLMEVKSDEERDRRLGPSEEKEIRRLMDGGIPANRERAFTLKYKPALICLFELGIETAMRLREAYSLAVYQVAIEQRTIFLEKTKNGSKRQVPLSSDAIRALNTYFAAVTSKEKSMNGWEFDDGMLFPWWKPEDPSKDALSKVDRDELRKTTIRLSRQFRDLFLAAGALDAHFHDLRHEATSRLFERTKLSEFEIAKITGHKDMRMLARYANLRASSFAERLW